MQRISLLTQQHTLDGGRKLLANTTSEQPRRASVSVPISHSSTTTTVATDNSNKGKCPRSRTTVRQLPAHHRRYL